MYCRPDASGYDGDVYQGIRLVRIPVLRLKSLETLSHSAASLLHALVRERHDIVELHALAPGIFSRLSRIASPRTVVKVQGLDWQRAKWSGLGSAVLRFAERQAVQHADCIAVVSRDLEAYFANRYNRETTYLPNGMPEPPVHFSPEDSVLLQHGLVAGRYLVFVGRLVPEKRIEDLIAAYSAVDSDFRLVIVGSGSYTDGYVKMLRAMARTDARVTFTGFQKGAALETLLASAGLFVLPSELEGLPLSLLEAVSADVPVLVSDIASHREIVGRLDSLDAFFRPRDVRSLRAAISAALGQLQQRKSQAKALRRQVALAYSWSSIADRAEAMYRAVAESGSTVRPRN